MPQRVSEQIRRFYLTLFRAWGRQHWWPADSRFEVVVGAYLTQNTAWTNVELALKNLRRAGVLSVHGIRSTPLPDLEILIRPAGYFRQKAQRLKYFVAFLDSRYAGSLRLMLTRPTVELRRELLALNGIGPETADSILLYAGNHPVFVVDAYTRRIMERHNLVSATTGYEEIRAVFEEALTAPGFVARCAKEHFAEPPPESDATPAGAAGHAPSRMSTARRTAAAQILNDMHGLIVSVGKNFCLKRQALCEVCPLRRYPHRPD